MIEKVVELKEKLEKIIKAAEILKNFQEKERSD